MSRLRDKWLKKSLPSVEGHVSGLLSVGKTETQTHIGEDEGSRDLAEIYNTVYTEFVGVVDSLQSRQFIINTFVDIP